MSTITISAFSPLINWPYPGTTATLRYTYTSDFVDSTGAPVLHGLYKDIACTVAAGVLSVPSHTIISTLDALVNPLVTLNAQFLDERGAKRSWQFQNFQVPTTTPTTMGALTIFNQGSSLVLPPDWYLDAIQVQNLINIAQGTLNDASDVVKGRTYTDVAPAVASAPTSVGSNSPRVTHRYYAGLYASLSAAIDAIGATEATLVIASQMLIGTKTVPANVILEFTNAGSLLLTTGQTTTILSDGKSWPTKKIFYNAVSGQGTVSFAGNKVLTEVWSEYWGGGVGVTDTINTAAWNAMNTALVTMAEGTIRAATGQYDFNGLVTIGTDSGFTNISIRGAGLFTLFNWTGSTSGTMFRVTKGRNNRFDDFRLGSSVAKGTSIGMILTGPAISLQTSGCTWANVSIRGFAKGLSLGEGNTSVGEQQFNNCNFSENATAVFLSGNGNTLVITFVNTSFGNNTLCGIHLGAGVADTHIVGGGFAANGLAGDDTTGDILLTLGWNTTVRLQNIRFEIGNGTTDTFRGGIINLGGFGTVNIDNCKINSTAVPTAVPFIMGGGYWSIDGMAAFGDGNDGFILYNADGNQQGSFTVRNSRITNSNTRTVPGGGVNTVALGIQFDPVNTGSQGMKITAENNFYSTALGAIVKHDNVEAIIGSTPSATGKVFATKRINANGQVTSDWFDISNQDATPSVKWANRFKEADGGATVQTNLIDGVDGQEIKILFTTGNRTIQDNANQQLAGGANFVGSANDILTLLNIGSNIWVEVSRSVN